MEKLSKYIQKSDMIFLKSGSCLKDSIFTNGKTLKKQIWKSWFKFKRIAHDRKLKKKN